MDGATPGGVAVQAYGLGSGREVRLPPRQLKGMADLVLDCFEREAPGLLIGNRKQHIGVAGLIAWAVTRETAPAKLPFGVLDGDRQPTRDQILVVAMNRLLPTELQGVGVAPLGRASHDCDASGKPRSLAT